MIEFTPELQLQTLFVLNERGRIVSTRERHPTPGPLFMLIRGTTSCAWAMHDDLPESLAKQLQELAREEPPTEELRRDPLHADRYVSVIGGRVDAGPAFSFPASFARPSDTAVVTDLSELEINFRGWTEDELPECSPILAVAENGHPVSICFCARRSDTAAEAGVETAQRHRGRGMAARVTAAWAQAIMASGRLPIYSTSWSNAASLAVARKLGLLMCATDWSLY